MTAFDSISPLGAAPERSATPNGFSGIKSEDFIKIIFTELSNQDPFQPNDSSALLEQLNSIRSIESDLELIEKLDSLVLENKMSGAAGMIGRLVEGLTPSNDRVGGTVVAVSREADDVILELDNGWRIPFARVETIYNE
ncbi:MAG: flagellar hook capping FlgD N-terminal domain-containing protein [Planctomycetota bacterium]|jgi:flagellar basal-body rod modification protein FlgD